MAHALIFAHRAEADLTELVDYIGARNPAAARRFGTRLLDRTVSGELAGRYERLFRSGGLLCHVTIPLPGADPAELVQRHAA